MWIRTVTLALLLMVNSGTLLTAFYGHSPIGRKTWQEMARIDLWYVQAFYVLYALWFFWPVFAAIWNHFNKNTFAHVAARADAEWHKKYGD